jgi:hypothetical protein
MMGEVIYWGEMLGVVGMVLLTVPNTSYVYHGYKAGMSFPSTIGLLVRTWQFWLHVACLAGILIFGILRSTNTSIVAELLRLLFGALFVMTVIILATIWGIRLIEK